MAEAFSKEAYLDVLLARLREPRTRASEEYHRQTAYRQISHFIHYINGRVYDVLETRNTKENAYAAAYAWYPDEVTKHYPAPEVDPEASITELQEDMAKVERIRTLASHATCIEGLKWIDKKIIRDCTKITKNKDTILLHFDDPKRDPVVLKIIKAQTFNDLCKDPDLTPEKVIRFFQSDEFSIPSEYVAERLVSKIKPEHLKPIIDWIESIKLHDMYDRKFNTLIIYDLLRRRYDLYQRGVEDVTDMVEHVDADGPVRNFIIDLIQFLDSIRADEEGGPPAEVLDGDSPDGGPHALLPGADPAPGPASGGESAENALVTQQPSGSALVMHRFDTRRDPLPAIFDLGKLQHGSARPLAAYTEDLLHHIYHFVHRVPQHRLAELGQFYERAADLMPSLPKIFEGKPGHDTSLRRLVSQSQQILRRMLNTVYLGQMIDGSLDFTDNTGNFDIDELMIFPDAFSLELSLKLVEDLHYSWRGDPTTFAGEQIRLHNILDDVLPGVRTRLIAAMEARKQLLDKGQHGLPRLGHVVKE